jgi:hypothetical protein
VEGSLNSDCATTLSLTHNKETDNSMTSSLLTNSSVITKAENRRSDFGRVDRRAQVSTRKDSCRDGCRDGGRLAWPV